MEKKPIVCGKCGGFMNIPVRAYDGQDYHKWCDPKEQALVKLTEADEALLKVKYHSPPTIYLESQEYIDL